MGEQLRDRVAETIVAAATDLISRRGESVTMADVAAAAGVGRATLYRYFPNRTALLIAISRTAVDDLSARIEQAELATVDPREGINRLTRAFLSVGRRYGALRHTNHGTLDHADLDRRVTSPVLALIERARQSGSLRGDLSASVLFVLFAGLLDAAVSQGVDDLGGLEPAAATVASIFLDGASGGSRDNRDPASKLGP